MVLLQVLTIKLYAQNSSVLSSGFWVKMSFEKSGVYKIGRPDLTAMGFDVGSLNPQHLAIYGRQGGMLPQKISSNREKGLIESSIFVSGENDGIFNSEDYILFYVDKVDQLILDTSNQNHQVIKNLYSDEIHYFITVKNNSGARLITLPNLGINFPEVREYNHILSHEQDASNVLSSGREWFGEQFGTSNELSFDLPTPELIPNRPIQLNIAGMVQAFNSSSYSISLNDQALGTLNFSAISNTRYGIKGNEASGNFTLNSSALSGVRVSKFKNQV